MRGLVAACWDGLEYFKGICGMILVANAVEILGVLAAVAHISRRSLSNFLETFRNEAAAQW